jgi:hypothetical protein
MGTSVLAVSVKAVIVPATVLLIKLIRHGWRAMIERVRKNLEDTLIASLVIWMLLILFNFVYTVPHGIRVTARSTRPPKAPAPPEPPSFAYEILSPIEPPPTPSFVYVVPGVWLLSQPAQWLMMIRHSGPDPVFNIEILFVDKDRQSAISTKGSATPEDIQAMQHTLNFSEIDPIEGVWAKDFVWPPLKPENEHYEVIVASRNGSFRENLQIRQTVGWQYRMKVINDQSKRVLLNCRDKNFGEDGDGENLPTCFPFYVTGTKSKSVRK